MTEIACEGVGSSGNCDTDQQSFKAYFSRWMTATAKICPFVHDTLMERIKTSATAAALQCRSVLTFAQMFRGRRPG